MFFIWQLVTADSAADLSFQVASAILKPCAFILLSTGPCVCGHTHMVIHGDTTVPDVDYLLLTFTLQDSAHVGAACGVDFQQACF